MCGPGGGRAFACWPLRPGELRTNLRAGVAVFAVAALAAVVLAVGSATVSAEDLAAAFTGEAFTVGMAATIRVTMGTAITRTATTVTERNRQTASVGSQSPAFRAGL